MPKSDLDYGLLKRPNEPKREGIEAWTDFAHILKQIIMVLRDIENTKIDLAVKPDFTIIDAYRIFNGDKRTISGERITRLELITGLRDGLDWQNFAQDDVYAWFKRIDVEFNGEMTYI